MATAAETIAIYNNVLQRDPTDAELAAFVTASQTPDGEEVQIDLLVNSSEAQDDVWPFVRVYQAIFGRVPDAAGLNFWVDAMRDGLTLQTIVQGTADGSIAGFRNSDEFVAEYGADVDPTSEAFITALYNNLLGRDPDAEGLEFFTNLPDSATVGDVVTAFTESPEFSDAINAQIRIFLEAAAEGTQDYEGSVYDVDNDGDVDQDDQDIIDDADQPIGDIFTLTDEIDDVVGTDGNDTFRAITDDALETADIIDGAGGDDVLNIGATAMQAAGSATPALSNIERINSSSTDALNLSSSTGVQQVWARDANAVFAGVAAGLVIGIDNATGAVTADVTFNGDVDLADDDNAVSLAVANNDGNTVDFTFGDADGNDQADIETVNVTASGGDAGVLDLGGFTALEALTVAGDGDLVVDVVDLAALVSIDGSAATGDLTVDLSGGAAGSEALETLTTGAGADAITVLNAEIDSETVEINAGAGNDEINFNVDNSGVATAASISGGADGDEFNLTATIQGAGTAGGGNLVAATDNDDLMASLVTIADFNAGEDVLDISGLYGGDRITQNTVDNAVAAANPDNLFEAATAALDVAGGGGIAAAGNDDLVLFNFDGNAYIGVDADASGDLSANDVLVEVTGVAVGDLVVGDNFVA